MASVPITPVSIVPAANTWTALGSAVASSKVEGSSLRVTNVGGADCNAKWRLTNGGTPVNRGGAMTIPVGTQDGTLDLEDRVPLPTGWSWEVWASASTNLEFSRTGWTDDA